MQVKLLTMVAVAFLVAGGLVGATARADELPDFEICMDPGPGAITTD